MTKAKVVSIAEALNAPVDAPILAQEGDQRPFGGRDDDDDFDAPRVPPDCPVKTLGIGTDGQTCWYLNMLGQLVPLGPRDHGKNNLHALFAPRTHLLAKYWPRWSEPKKDRAGNVVKESEIVGFKQDDASEALISACGASGIFDPQGRVRGRGAHRGDGRALTIHFGDKVMVAKPGMGGVEWHDTGLIANYVYPSGGPTPRPHHEPGGVGVVEQLLALINTWNWRRGHVDAILALGWLAQTTIAGAMDWRSHLFVTGGAGTGKSSWNGKDGLCDRLLGRGVLRTGGATEAAVRQKLRDQTIPVMFDEFEPNAFNEQKLAVILELARIASSGDDMHKGGSDHKAAEFTLRSCFQFSAILVPHMEPQDRSRFAILGMDPVREGAKKLDLDGANLPHMGAVLARRMIDGWSRWHDTYLAYHDGLMQSGHTRRSADTFGTLLAAADLALYDHIQLNVVDDWVAQFIPTSIAEISDAAADHDRCLNHLTTSTVQARGGDARETLSTWLTRAVANERTAAEAGLEAQTIQIARTRLAELGLKVVNAKRLADDASGRPRFGAVEHIPGQPCYLAVAQDHRSLGELFATTKWKSGGWSQTLARSPAAIRGVKAKFAGRSLTAVLVPIEHAIDSSSVAGWVACPSIEAIGQ
ncbi:MAG TPA: hypothetical protein QF469_06510 [Sphingomonas sanguinis]|uniref:hypothetical protein n=1 Tax=Sphingomonas sanguinis TaxID=33051 RepID=UPI002ABF4854|nr:hypothetical protein [Sphingomonas sanguinis]